MVSGSPAYGVELDVGVELSVVMYVCAPGCTLIETCVGLVNVPGGTLNSGDSAV